jgi:hypothetical protein
MVSHDGIHVPGLSETIKDDINISKFVMGPLFKVTTICVITRTINKNNKK